MREIATAVGWPCEVKTLFREENLGCKYGPKTGISWLFEHEEQGIILEDDCLPHPDFFTFCETLLKLYAKDDRVWVITGDNFQNGVRRGEASYYFSRYNHVWGWATWRSAWQKADMDIRFWSDWKRSKGWRYFLSDPVERRYWERIFDRMYHNEIDTWDYPWTASVWYHGGFTATPNVNLVKNIGFGSDATHTTNKKFKFAYLPVHQIGNLRHPSGVNLDFSADIYTFDYHFGGRNLRFPISWIIFPKRLFNFSALRRLMWKCPSLTATRAARYFDASIRR